MEEKPAVEIKNKVANKEAAMRGYRVIARNMPFNISDEEILKFFSGAHSIKRHTKNGILTGAVFVQCNNMADAKRFIETCNNKELEGRKISVSYLEDKDTYTTKMKKSEQETSQEKELDENEIGRKRRKAYEESLSSKSRKVALGEEERTLFVTNISFRDGEKEISAVFEKYGEVEQCTVMSNKETGVSLGRAFVLFKDPASCKKALKDQIVLNDRVLLVLKYVSPEVLKQRDEEKNEKDKKRAKNIKDRKEGRLPPRDPAKLSTCRVHISHMDKKHNRKSVSKTIEGYFEKQGRKVKLRGVNLSVDRTKRNPGYCFVTFKFPEDAAFFIDKQRDLQSSLGMKMTAEYAMESKEFLEKGIKKKPSKEDRAAKRKEKENSNASTKENRK